MLHFTRIQRAIRQHKRWTALVVVVAALAAIAIVVEGAAQPTTQDAQVIRQLCYQAVFTDQTLAVRTTNTTKSVLTTRSVVTTDLSPINTAQMQQMQTHAVNVLGHIYTGDVLTRKISVLQDSIQRYATTDIRYLGGGVDSMTFSQVIVTGNTATVTAQAVIWAEMVQVHPDKSVATATPKATINFSFTLVKINGQWLINGETGSFAPGSEP